MTIKDKREQAYISLIRNGEGQMSHIGVERVDAYGTNKLGVDVAYEGFNGTLESVDDFTKEQIDQREGLIRLVQGLGDLTFLEEKSKTKAPEVRDENSGGTTKTRMFFDYTAKN